MARLMSVLGVVVGMMFEIVSMVALGEGEVIVVRAAWFWELNRVTGVFGLARRTLIRWCDSSGDRVIVVVSGVIAVLVND